MSKIITLLTVFLFFFCTLSVSADGIEGFLGLDPTEWDYDGDGSSDDVDIDSTVGGGGDSNSNGEVNKDLVGTTTSGSEIIAAMTNNPTGFFTIKAVNNSLSIYKAGDKSYLLRCSESDTKGMTYSVISILGVNCISNRPLSGSDTYLDTESLAAGNYLVVVRKANHVQKVFKIIL